MYAIYVQHQQSPVDICPAQPLALSVGMRGCLVESVCVRAKARTRERVTRFVLQGVSNTLKAGHIRHYKQQEANK
jgi:hypothetical protein